MSKNLILRQRNNMNMNTNSYYLCQARCVFKQRKANKIANLANELRYFLVLHCKLLPVMQDCFSRKGIDAARIDVRYRELRFWDGNCKTRKAKLSRAKKGTL